MTFRLIVTRPDQTEFLATTDPLPNREAAGMAALRALSGEGVRFGIAGMAFGREVRDAGIGESVTHESGYSFRTEEF
jgi:hypothetical protein